MFTCAICACATLKERACLQRAYSETEESMASMEYPPNQTLYINNLNEKVKKEGKFTNHSCWDCVCIQFGRTSKKSKLFLHVSPRF